MLDRLFFPPCCIAVEVGVLVLASRAHVVPQRPLLGVMRVQTCPGLLACWLQPRLYSFWVYQFLAEGGKFTAAVDCSESRKCYKSKIVLGCVQWVNYPRSSVGGSILCAGRGGSTCVYTVSLLCNVFHSFGVSLSTAAPDKMVK